MRYLFQISIGPVQEFIVRARRTRDLWFGSWMLSKLSQAAAKAVHDWSKNLIFPSPEVIMQAASAGQNAPASVSNKIVAIIETEDIKKEGERIKRHVFRQLAQLRTSASSPVSKKRTNA